MREGSSKIKYILVIETKELDDDWMRNSRQELKLISKFYARKWCQILKEEEIKTKFVKKIGSPVGQEI